MMEYDGHPLFDPNITWKTIQDLERERLQQSMWRQSERESGYQKRRKRAPDYLLSDDVLSIFAEKRI